MKKKITLLSLLTATLFINAQSWEWVGTRGVGPGSVTDYDIAITGDSTVHVAYNLDGQNRTVVSINNNGVWSSSISYLTGGNGKFIDMKTGVNDTCYLALSNANYDQSGNAFWTGNPNHDWWVYGNNGYSLNSGPADYLSIDVDQNGVSYIALDKRFGKTQVYKFVRATNNYTPLGGTEITSESNGKEPNIALSMNNVPYLAFQDDPNSGRTVSLIKWNETAVQWDTVGTNLSTGEAENIRIEFHTDNSLYLLYTDDLEGSKAHVKKYANSVWTDLGYASNGITGSVDLKISPDGVPVITYGGSGGVIKAYNGTNWQTVGNTSTDFPSVNKLAFGTDGTLYAVGKDFDNGGKVSVRKFRGDLINLAASHVAEDNKFETLKLYPNPTNDLVNLVGSFNDIKVVNISGKVLISTNKNQFSVNELSYGVYYVLAEDSNGVKYSSKLIKN